MLELVLVAQLSMSEIEDLTGGERPIEVQYYYQGPRTYWGRPYQFRGYHPYSYGYPQWGPRWQWRDPYHQFHMYGGYCQRYGGC